MSKVDLEVFKSLAEALDRSMDARFIYYLSEGDITVPEGWGFSVVQNDDYDEYSGHYHNVFSLKGKLYSVTYTYESHWGTDYDGIISTIKEVKPIEKTITVYEGV